MDEDEFYATFYCASVTRCDPGRAPSGRGDRTPTSTEQRLCDVWRERELELLRPRLIVTVGGLAARRLLGTNSVGEAVGRRYELDYEKGGAAVIPLPHPSGASGWLNVPENRARVADAVKVIRAALADHVPAANGRLLAAKTCLYTVTPDGDFIIDRMPGSPSIIVASPCSGHGFKFAPVIGEILADLATTGTTRHDISRFRLDRFR